MTNRKKKAKIRELNDLLRTTMIPALGRVVMTEGVADLGYERREEAITKIRQFNAFTKKNDPHEEHDFGEVVLNDHTRIFWKIDYYDKDLEMGSEDPSDPGQTTRVLTIMLADEY